LVFLAGRFRQLLFGVFIGLVGVIVNLASVGSALEEKFDLYWLFQLRGAVSVPDEVVISAVNSHD
jgi:adenylate cyclase